MDAKLKAMLKDLGDAIAESVSSSDRVAESLDRLRSHGYRANVNLDARIAVEHPAGDDAAPGNIAEDYTADFRINVRDLRFLKSVGIDPTRRVRRRRPPATSRVPRERRVAS